MPELPWEKWYPTNWASEPGLRLCEASTRGIWFEAINTMMLQQTAEVSGTIDQLASLCICRVQQMSLAIAQLREFKIAEIAEQNGNITITCRKRARDQYIKHLRRKAGIASATNRQHTPQQPVPTNDPTKGQQTPASTSTSVQENGECEGKEGENGKWITEARAIIHFLNESVGRSFRETSTNLTTIQARFKEGGVEFEGVKKMILRQKALWANDPTMCEYLRIETLFAKSKFDSYYAAKDLPIRTPNSGETRRENPRNFGVTNDIEAQKRAIADKMSRINAERDARYAASEAAMAAEVAPVGHPPSGSSESR